MTQNNTDLQEVEDPKAKYYEPKPEGEKAFWKTHIVKKHLHPVADDAQFNGSNVAKDKTRKADKSDLPEEKMSSPEKKKREEVVKAMKDKTAEFKAKYGDRWKDVMYATATKQAMGEEALDEDSQAASSDSPSSGGGGPTAGSIDPTSHIQHGQPVPMAKGNSIKEMLEKIALQAAELHDSLGENPELQDWAKQKLGESRECLQSVYKHIKSGSKNNEGQKDPMAGHPDAGGKV